MMEPEDRRHQDNGQGRVKDPAHDGRLKANRDRGISLGTTTRREDSGPTGKGRVKDPSRDRRLRGNRQ
jgi:hypothetical protein